METRRETENGYKKVRDILDLWENGDFDGKDAALELFCLPQKDLVHFITAVFPHGRGRK